MIAIWTAGQHVQRSAVSPAIRYLRKAPSLRSAVQLHVVLPRPAGLQSCLCTRVWDFDLLLVAQHLQLSLRFLQLLL